MDIIRKSIFQKAKDIKEGGFSCSVCSYKNTELWKVVDFNVLESLKIF
jgi:hypothetical protein